MSYSRLLLLPFLCLLLSFSLAGKAQPRSLRDIRLEGYRLRFTDTAASVRLQRAALGMALRENNMDEVVTGYTMLSFTYAKDYQVKAASDCADSAYFLAQKTESMNALAYGNLAMGYIKIVLKQPTEGITYMHIAYDRFKRLKNYSMLAKVTHGLAKCLMFTGGADEYAGLSLKYAGLSGDVDDIIAARQLYAYLHFNSASDPGFSMEDAVRYYRETNRIIEKNEALIYTKSNLLAVYLNFAAVISERPYPGSDTVFLATLDKAMSYMTRYNLSAYYSNIVGLKGDYFTRKGDYAAAQKLYEDGISYAQSFPRPNNTLLASFYYSLKNLALLRRDYIGYYKFDTAFIRYYKLENNEEITSSLVNADARYQSSQKAAMIKSLEIKNKMQRSNNWLTLGAAFLLFLGLVFMIRAYYFKRKYYRNKESLLLEREKTVVLELQLQKKENTEIVFQKLLLEHRLLQSQMDPHFVFNALGNIKCFLMQQDVKNADSYLTKFSRLMRQVLTHSKKEFISLEDEIDTLRNYMDMQQLRLNHSFDYEIILDENTDIQTEIPPMLIQPFVENAIEHGLKPLDPAIKGALKLCFREDALLDNIVCTIQDNGIGVEYSRKAGRYNSGHQSLATSITKERIDSMKGQNGHASLDIRELKGPDGAVLGTAVVICIPIKSQTPCIRP